MNATDKILPVRCRSLLYEWHEHERHDPLFVETELHKRVRNALANLETPPDEYVQLLREVRGNEFGWTGAKSPAEFQKEFGFGPTAWRRWIEEGKLIVDRISRRSVRVRMDCYRKYRKSDRK